MGLPPLLTRLRPNSAALQEALSRKEPGRVRNTSRLGEGSANGPRRLSSHAVTLARPGKLSGRRQGHSPTSSSGTFVSSSARPEPVPAGSVVGEPGSGTGDPMRARSCSAASACWQQSAGDELWFLVLAPQGCSGGAVVRSRGVQVPCCHLRLGEVTKRHLSSRWAREGKKEGQAGLSWGRQGSFPSLPRNGTAPSAEQMAASGSSRSTSEAKDRPAPTWHTLEPSERSLLLHVRGSLVQVTAGPAAGAR